MTTSRYLMASVLLVLVTVALWPAAAALQPSSAQRVFETPEAAAKAVVEAAKADDTKTILEIFGARHVDLLERDETVRRENFARFVKAAAEYRFLRVEDDGRVTIIVGYDAWPFPIPLVRDGSRWRFDTDAGREEVINRRIGANELATIATLRAYGDLQRQYASKPRDNSNVRQFAQKIRSAPGKKDGLYWDADPVKGEEQSPVGPLIAEAKGRRLGEPYRGYYFRILTRQGPAAPAGRYSYVINGRMIAGFAAVAYPAEYGKTGIKTFIVNHYGVVYEKDLGRDTGKIAAAMTEYNPDRSWNRTTER